MSAEQTYNQIFSYLESHQKWIENSIPLIASENVVSPAVRETLISDFGDRYAEGWPGERVYAGTKYIDQVEVICSTLAKKVFKAEFADVRPISGVVANLVVYSAFTKPLDRMMALSIKDGGHISHGRSANWGTAGLVHGLKVQHFEYNEETFEIDIDESRKKVETLAKKGKKIDLFLLGQSVFLFPAPVKQIVDLAKEYNAKVLYDGAHVAGLIAGGEFQDPLRDGVDAFTCSTHKTLFGPQHGMVLAKKEYSEVIKKCTFPGLTSNHHLHNVAGLAVALCEVLAFGKDYAKQVIKNAQAFGKALNSRGFNVLGSNRGFTKSHQLWVSVADTPMRLGSVVENRLEEANIIINRNLLPWDLREGRDYKKPSGIRLGTSEVTRLGMKEDQMDQIAEWFSQVIIKGKKPSQVAEEITEFKKDFKKIHYAFNTTQEAYEYIKIR
ncbi:MAG: serine hydroxymethyltransferase [Candidatus Ranarchaeia archaeon]